MVAEKSPTKASRHIIIDGDICTESDVTMKEPPKTHKRVTVKTKKDFLQVITKIKTLPRLTQELYAMLVFYEKFKEKYMIFQIFLELIEFLFGQSMAMLKVLMLFPAVMNLIASLCEKVSFIDEFLCHQLDFADTQLQKFEVGFLFKHGGFVDQLFLFNTLMLRLLFIWPRLCVRMIFSCYEELVKEMDEDKKIAASILWPPKVRRSKRRRQLQGSPGKKRKHEELEEGLPEYMVCFESYREEDDPDYVPGSGDDLDETELTSASEDGEDTVSEEEDGHVNGHEVSSPTKQSDEVNIPFIENVEMKKPIM